MWTGGIVGYSLRAAAIVAYTVAASTWALLLPRRQAPQRLLAAAPGWARTMLRLCGVRVTVEGADLLRQESPPYVYICNHASLLDIPVLLVALPEPLCFLYKQGLECIPFFGWVLRRMPYVPITRRPIDAYAHLRLAAERVHQYGLSPVVFAEGGRSFDGTVRPFKRGAILLAQELRLPIVPVAIAGTYALLPPKTLRFRPGHVRVRIGSPQHVPARLSRQEQQQWLQQLRMQIAEWVAQMSSQPTEQPWKLVPSWNESPN